MGIKNPIERRHEIALREVGNLAACAHAAEARADELQESLDFLLNEDNWLRMWEQAPKRLPDHVTQGAADIGMDMVLEAGWYITIEENKITQVTNCLRSMFEIGFLYGAAFQAEPSNDPDHESNRPPSSFDEDRVENLSDDEGVTRSYVNGYFVKLADGVPPYVFDLLFEKAVDALWEVFYCRPEDDKSYWIGRSDAAIEALEAVLHVEEVSASQLVGSAVARKALDRG